MAINKVVFGNNTLIDLTSDTVTADKLAQGITAHDKSGSAITGTMKSDIADALTSCGFTIVSDEIVTGTRTNGNSGQVFSDVGADSPLGMGLIVYAIDTPSMNQAVIRLEGNNFSKSCSFYRYPNETKYGLNTNPNGFLQSGIRYRAIIYKP